MSALSVAALSGCGSLGLRSPRPAPSRPVDGLIFDADMSSDHDDVGAIATLHALADLGECRILAMMVSSTNGSTATCMDAINTYYGRPEIPIGVRPDVGGGEAYASTISEEFPHALASSADCLHAVDLYRKTLASQPDQSVSIVTTGYLTNLEALLRSPADSFSSLSGRDLIRQKVKTWFCMGGDYPSGKEFNFRASGDDSAYVVVNGWPVGAVFSGFAVGTGIVTGGRLQQTPATNPIRRVYEIKGGGGHPSYDQTAVYAAVRLSEGLWGAVDVGHNTTDPAGGNAWKDDVDPVGLQNQSYLVERSRSPVQSAIDALMMAPPKKNGAGTVPTQPTNLRATAFGDRRIDLRWTNNAYDAAGFVVERLVGGRYQQVANPGAEARGCSLTDLESTADTALRVKAVNEAGSSTYCYVRLYSGWTEHDRDTAGSRPLYDYFSDGNLRWASPGDFQPDHLTVNNDSSHGPTVKIHVDVGSIDADGRLYVYFFYQDPKNWYRLSYDDDNVAFEKCLAGIVSQIGASAAIGKLGDGALVSWELAVTPHTLTFSSQGRTALRTHHDPSLDSGRIGLGGAGRNPIWENFSFS